MKRRNGRAFEEKGMLGKERIYEKELDCLFNNGILRRLYKSWLGGL
jgi:hypothetical protein